MRRRRRPRSTPRAPGSPHKSECAPLSPARCRTDWRAMPFLLSCRLLPLPHHVFRP